MSDRPGQLLVHDDAGNFIGGATILIAPTASVVNGRLSLPGISEGIDGLPANPTAQVGLTAVNGAATTFMRSDAAPALDQAISPTWTGAHTHTALPFAVRDGATPRFKVYNNSGAKAQFDLPQILLPPAGIIGGMADDGMGGYDPLNLAEGYIQFAEGSDPVMRIHGGDNNGLEVTSESGIAFESGGLISFDVLNHTGFFVNGTERARIGLGLSVGSTTDPGAGVVNAQTGYRVAGGAASGNVLRGNGTNFVSATLAASDISGLGTAAVLNTGTSSGEIPILGAGGKLASSVLPALAITDTFVVASQAAMLALTAETGDVAVRTDLNKSFILAGANPGTLAHWQELLTPTDAVLSVNGQTGVVVLTTQHINEHASNLYYTDERVDDRVSALILGTANQITPTYNDGAGTLTLSLPQNIHTGASPTFTGLTLSGNLSAAGVASSLIPSVTDTYDLGSSTKLWRKGWLSELDAILFAQNTVSVIGGWLLVTKNEGAIPVGQDVGTGETSIDFGQAMTANDFVLFRAAGSVEYVQVGSVVSGTRYNVTRNLDGTGANAWPAGSVYAVLGNTGNGRIEINANSTPRISLIRQGASYNAQTELLRVGDLNGDWGYSSETYGFVAGEYAAGKAWVSVDPTNGFRIGLHNVINGQWDTSGNLALGQVATNSGNAFWNNSNKRFEFRGGAAGTVVQAYIDTNGALVMNSASVSGTLTAGGGNVTLDGTSGLTMANGSGAVNAVKWGSFAGEHSAIYATNNTPSADLIGRAVGGPTGITVVAFHATDTGNAAVSSLRLVSEPTNSRSYAVFGTGGHTATHPFVGLLVGATGAPDAMLDVRGAAYVQMTGIGTTAADGLALINTTAAAVGAQQYSPRLRLTGRGWKTNATAASQIVDWSVQVVPVQGAANPTSYLDFASQIDGTGYTSRMTLTSAGLLTVSAATFTGAVTLSGGVSGNVAFDTNTLFVDATNDRVGVGTTSPAVSFQVTKNQNGVTAARVTNNSTGAGAFASFQLLATGGGFSGSFFQNGSGNSLYGGANSFNMVQEGNSPITLCTTDLVRLTVSGAGALRLHTYGAGTLTTDASGNVTAASDERLKRIWGEFGDGLGVIRQLKPIVYRWKEGEGRDTEYDYVGFSAQNVQAALPLAVMAGPNGMLSLQDRPLIAVTVNAVKELDTRIAALERELETLKRARAK